MSFFKELKDVLGRDPDSRTKESDISEANPLFVYVKMPGDIDPLDRHELFADPIDKSLERENLGMVTGGGSHEDESETVTFCGIDVELYNLAKGVALLRAELVRLQAPIGTTLLYELEGREREEPVYPKNVC